MVSIMYTYVSPHVRISSWSTVTMYRRSSEKKYINISYLDFSIHILRVDLSIESEDTTQLKYDSNLQICEGTLSIKGCNSNFEVHSFQIVEVAANETTTLHKSIYTRKALGHYNNNGQQFNRHVFR